MCGTLILNAGETSVSKTLVRTLQDTEVEDDETFTLRLARVPSTVVGGTISAEVTILDDDFVTPKPTNLRVTQSGSRLSLSWSAPAPPDAGDTIYIFGYEVGYKKSDGSWINHGEILTGGERTFDDPLSRQTSRSIDVNALSPGATYDVRVRASFNLFRAIDGTTHRLLSDWIYWTGTSSGVGGSGGSGVGGSGGSGVGGSGGSGVGGSGGSGVGGSGGSGGSGGQPPNNDPPPDDPPAQDPPAPNSGKVGDFNGDGNVDLLDYDLFVQFWDTKKGEAGYDEKYDLDGDDVVALSDYSIFVENWGK